MSFLPPFRLLVLTLLAGLLAPSVALADTLSGGDTAWILTSSALVLFMTLPGLALFYGGLVRTPSVLSVLMQCFTLAGLVTILWLAFGYSMAFGPPMISGIVGGFDKAFLAGVTADTLSGTIPEVLFFVFQLTFAIITPALIVGTFVERMRFSAVLLFSAIWLVLVYLPICHMTWGGGYFGEMGVFDFAGGIVVHITAGIAALVTCIVIGPRRGYPATMMPPHNLTMCVTGTGMLWVGWFGFNGGSQLAADGGAAMAVAVTQISASVAAITWMSIEWIKHKKPSALGLVTGAIAGLAAVTPASGFIGPIGGFCIGLASGVICYLASTSMKRALGYDDSLDVFGVHGVGGIVGTLLVAFFAHEQFGGNQGDLAMGSQFVTQLTAAAITAVYTGVATWLILKLVDAVVGIRVAEEEEIRGLDLSSHDEVGYNL